MKEKDFTGTQWEFTKERVQKLFPMSPSPPQTENKNKTHKAQQQVPKTKTKNLQCSILKPESASWKFMKQPCKLLQHVLLFKCPGPGTLQMEPPHYYCLKKSDSPSTSTSSPTFLSQSWSKCFKLQVFSSSVTLPTPKRINTQS